MARKLAVVLLAVAMILSYVGTAAAAQFSDVAGYKHEAAIGRLASLGLLAGYPDGTFKPDQTITRAEFAKVIVVALGLKEAAEVMTGVPTAFSDVAANHWATGYINVAASQGIVNGYPDGTFKPDAQVTYAEALAMILRALGYEPTLKGVWPAKYLVKAAELGITKGVTFAANVPATRGDVAALVDNSLTVAKVVQVGYGDQAKYVVSGTPDYPEKKTLMKDLGCTEIKGRVIDAGVLFGSDLDDDEVAVDVDNDGVVDSNEVYTVASDIDPTALAGFKVTAWANDDGEIFLVTENEATTAIADTVAAHTYQVTKVTLKDKDKEYTVASNALIIRNNKKVSTTGVVADAWKDNNVKVVLNDKGEVAAMVVTDYSQPRMVKSVVSKYERIDTKFGAAVQLKDKDYTIYKNGKKVALTDLAEGDLFWVWNDGDEYLVEAVSKTVTGTLSAAATDWSKVTVGGTSYKVGAGVQYSEDGGASFTTAAPTSLLGTSVTLYLDPFGKARAVVGTAKVVTGEQYVLVYEVKDVTGLQTDTYIRAYASDGSKKDYKLVDSSVLVGVGGEKKFEQLTVKNAVYAQNHLFGGAPDIDDFICTLTLNDDGTVKKIVAEDVDPLVQGSVTLSTATLDKDNDRIKIGSAWYAATSSTVIWDNTGTTKGKAVSWTAVEKGTGTLDLLAKVDKGKLVAVVVQSTTTGQLSTDKVLAMVTGKQLVADGQKLILDVEGAETSYTFDLDDVTVTAEVYSNKGVAASGTKSEIYAKIEVGDLVEITLDAAGKPASIAEVVDDSNYVEDTDLDGVWAGEYKIQVGNAFYWGSADTQVYDCTGGSPVNVGWGGLTAHDKVQVFLDSSGFVRAIKIVE